MLDRNDFSRTRRNVKNSYLSRVDPCFFELVTAVRRSDVKRRFDKGDMLEQRGETNLDEPYDSRTERGNQRKFGIRSFFKLFLSLFKKRRCAGNLVNMGKTYTFQTFKNRSSA